MPLAAICATTPRHAVPVLVDGAHAPGMLTLDPRSDAPTGTHALRGYICD
jgi:selenocysteine lyase/cysteine desulfurase